MSWSKFHRCGLMLFVGGRDSLNLALLTWKNPVVIYSAQPNTPLPTVDADHLNLEVSPENAGASSVLVGMDLPKKTCLRRIGSGNRHCASVQFEKEPSFTAVVEAGDEMWTTYVIQRRTLDHEERPR